MKRRIMRLIHLLGYATGAALAVWGGILVGAVIGAGFWIWVHCQDCVLAHDENETLGDLLKRVKRGDG